MRGAPPVARLALAFAAGVAWVIVGVSGWWAPLVVAVLLFSPKRASRRPGSWSPLLASAMAGALLTFVGGAGPDCTRAHSGSGELSGRFLAVPRGGSGPLQTSDGCGPITVVLGESVAVPAGRPVRLVGSWREGRTRPWFRARDVSVLDSDPGPEWEWVAVRWRADLARRVDRLYGPRGPLVAALTLARREGFDPELRETFARTGLAHLLAISGFHVGVIAGTAFTLFRLIGTGRRRARLGATLVAWLYVGMIGFPDAASRAALILAFVAVSSAKGRPPTRWGPLGAALLILLWWDPSKLGSPGFQLSFAGAAGLLAWSNPLTEVIARASRGRCPRGLASATAAGVSATLATLPIVAWHFERVSLVGIPATLAAGPVIALALPGAIASLTIDFVSPTAAAFLAGGVDALLAGVERGAGWMAGRGWASVWVTKNTVWAAASGVALARFLSSRPGVGATARRLITLTYGMALIAVWPVLLTLQGMGTVEIYVMDVGQGDAIGLRSPKGRWVLVDAGPPDRGASDPGAQPVVRDLRERGVARLEALFLTHPDLDHIGGASAVLAVFEVGAVYDPALPAPKREFVELLESARDRGIAWRAARAGDRVELDGMVLTVLHPAEDAITRTDESNLASVVLHLRFGAFDALLTGDAYKETERELTDDLTDELEVLKVGHHGSDTSTDSLLLERTSPQVALISVGRNNRYGHPSPAVLGRLGRAAIVVHRTDQQGTLSVLGKKDGSFRVRTERGRPRL